jgi:hypothetical protein
LGVSRGAWTSCNTSREIPQNKGRIGPAGHTPEIVKTIVNSEAYHPFAGHKIDWTGRY